MRSGLLLGISMMAACYRAPTAALAVHAAPPPVVEPSALVAAAPPAHDTVLAAKQTLWVGGCNTACLDCSLGSYQTYVVGTLTRTGGQLFPNPDPPSPGYSCGAEVAIGERVTL